VDYLFIERVKRVIYLSEKQELLHRDLAAVPHDVMVDASG
jgi:hypothetical protein